jgi:hypothetical protein
VSHSLREAAEAGTDIVWLVLHGHLSPMLRKMPTEEKLLAKGEDYRVAAAEGCTHVIDLEYMSRSVVSHTMQGG